MKNTTFTMLMVLAALMIGNAAVAAQGQSSSKGSSKPSPSPSTSAPRQSAPLDFYAAPPEPPRAPAPQFEAARPAPVTQPAQVRPASGGGSSASKAD